MSTTSAEPAPLNDLNVLPGRNRLSLVLVLPIPFGNLLPSAAICIIALGVLERDGLWVMGGVAAGAVAVAVVGGMAYAVIKSLIFVAVNAF